MAPAAGTSRGGTARSPRRPRHHPAVPRRGPAELRRVVPPGGRSDRPRQLQHGHGAAVGGGSPEGGGGVSAPERVLPVLRLDLLALPEAVPELRRAVREWLDEPCADVQLCVTELVSNVIRHVGEGAPVRVRVARTGTHIRVEVTDPDPHTLPV